MGKASKWFRALLGLKTTDPNQNRPQKPPPKKKWSFAKSHKEKHRLKCRQDVLPDCGDDDGNDASRHAIAMAAATAAVAEAAVTAAQAADAVVQLTSSGRNTSMVGGGGDGGALAHVAQRGAGYVSREEWAAVMVQSHFRAYLSRRALRALKALVKLQALVRGHLVRKQTAYALRRLQALVRAQTRARVGRVLNSESPHSSIKSSHFSYPGPPTPEKSERVIRARCMKHEQLTMLKRNSSKTNSSINYDPEKSHASRIRLDSRMGERSSEQESFTTRSYLPTDDDKSAKILEVDNGNLHVISRNRTLFHSSHLDQNCRSFSTTKDAAVRCQSSVLSPSSGEAQSLNPLKFEQQDADESAFCTAYNSPTFYSASSRGGSSRKGAFTPTKSDGSRSCFSNYSDHPNYMAYTESSKAKVRSVSAPKQRPQFERLSSTKRYSIHGCVDLRSTQRLSALHVNFTTKAYPGSGRLDRLGMPVRGGY